jgi:DNA repair exonuclease SbcCD ATPase subunit
MAVPAQVQARADKADELLKQASDSEKPAQADPPKPEDRDAKPPAQETVEGLKQQLATLQGKYNAEIVALKEDVNILSDLKHSLKQRDRKIQDLLGQLQDANGKLNEANTLIGDLQKRIAEPADDVKSVLSALSEEDQEYLRGEGFDEKIVGIIAKALQKKEPPRQNADEVARLRKDIEQQKIDTFWKELREKVPDWDSINASDAFLDWLDERLPYSSETRLTRLKAAQAISDYTTVIQMFNDFKSANPAKENKPEHRIDPAKQIEPDSSVAHQPPADGKETPAGKTYTRKEIETFYKEFALASAKGKATEEMKKIDADILLANHEGRIQG